MALASDFGGRRWHSRRHCGRDEAQMSVELMVVLPVAIALALVVTNGLSFMAACASFDRIARNAVRIYACAPAYGEDASSVIASIENAIAEAVPEENVTFEVTAQASFLGQVTYAAAIDFEPTLFGLTLRDEVFGVALPRLHHEVTLTVDPYHPGMLF